MLGSQTAADHTAYAAPVPPAVLLGGGPIAVPVARTLGQSGVPVIALGYEDDPVRHSRYCERFVDLGAGEGVQERWLHYLTGEDVTPGVILPCNDDGLELVARHRATLVARGHRPIEGSDAATLALLDKCRTYELARELDIPAPQTLLVGAAAGVGPAAEQIGFPCAVKPRHSHLSQRHYGLAKKLFVAPDPEVLAEVLDELGERGIEALLTELIPGADHDHHSYYTYIDADGEPIVNLTKQTLRKYPPGSGLATYHMIDHREEVIELGRRLLVGAGVRGVANVEFKRDARDGQLKLIECNLRFTAANELVRHAGIDLAALAYARVTGRPDPPLSGYRAGVRLWNPLPDVRSLVAHRRQGDLTVARWIASLLRPLHLPLWSWRDPGPSIRVVARRTRRLVARRPRATQRSEAVRVTT